MSNSNSLPERGRHRAAIPAALYLIALIAACSTGTAPTATPRATDDSSAAATPSIPPTRAPSPSPLSSPTFAAGQIEHPTARTDVVLRMEVGGGFVPMGAVFTEAPTFTLYGDGTVIFQPTDNRGLLFGEDAFLPWRVGRLDEEAVQALLNFALTSGRLANARNKYDGGMIADAQTTVFTLNAGGRTKQVSVYGLAEMPEPGADGADRAGFAQLADVLRTFETQEELGAVEDYEPALYRIGLLEAFGEPAQEPIEWPWSDITANDFVAGRQGAPIAHLDSKHVAKLLEVPNGGHAGVWVIDPDEKPVQLAVRPLLPDEIELVQEASS